MDYRAFKRYGSLVTLTICTVILSFTLKLARTPRPPDASEVAVGVHSTGSLCEESRSDLFLASTAVIMTEAVKVLASTSLSLCYHSFAEVVHSFRCAEFSLMMVPAFIYTVQSYLQIVGVSYISLPLFQVLNQLKLVFTAMLSVLFLGRKLTQCQWYAVILCSVGVGCAVVDPSIKQSGGGSSGVVNQSTSSIVLGSSAIIASCITSALGAVFSEKVYKQTEMSIWLRNIHLALCSMAVASVSTAAKDSQYILCHGFFYRYNMYVWLAIVVAALIGLLSAVVSKYADNVAKGFATGISIILIGILSSAYLSTVVTGQFCVAVILIMVSLLFYSADGAHIKRFAFVFNVRRICALFALCMFAFSCWSQLAIKGVHLDEIMTVYSRVSVVNGTTSTRIGRHTNSTRTVASISVAAAGTAAAAIAEQQMTSRVVNALPKKLHFMFLYNAVSPDCGGCKALATLETQLRLQGHSTSVRCCNDFKNTTEYFNIAILPETLSMSCRACDATVRWILAPVGVKTDGGVTEKWSQDDLVWNYGMLRMGAANPIPVSNLLQAQADPSDGDGFDIGEYPEYPRNGTIYMYRKAEYVRTSIRPLHDSSAQPQNGTKSYLTHERFVCYDPYSFHTQIAAMLGCVSIVYPWWKMSKHEYWMTTLYAGYLDHFNLTVMQGVAYGDSPEEIEFAKSTMHLVRGELTMVKEWGFNFSIPRFVRDVAAYVQGQRSGFESGKLVSYYYPPRWWKKPAAKRFFTRKGVLRANILVLGSTRQEGLPSD